MELETYGPKIQLLAQARRAVTIEKAGAAGKEFADKAAKETGAVKSASGMVYLSLKDGTGASPAETDVVKVNYRGTLIDGKEFDSSYKRGEPAEFPLNGVIKCWTEGVQKMKVGGKARTDLPADHCLWREWHPRRSDSAERHAEFRGGAAVGDQGSGQGSTEVADQSPGQEREQEVDRPDCAKSRPWAAFCCLQGQSADPLRMRARIPRAMLQQCAVSFGAGNSARKRTTRCCGMAGREFR